MYLTKEQAQKFINIYGNDDVYFSHANNSDGSITIYYFSHMLKFLSDQAALDVVEQAQKGQSGQKYRNLLDKITLTNEKVIFNSKQTDPTLKNNYEQFLEDEQLLVYSK